MTEGSEMADVMQKMVETVDEVALHTAECVTWTVEHGNCKGCRTQLGCSKVVHLMGIQMIPLTYHPKDYDDFARMNTRIQELITMCMEAKTPEEVKAIPTF